MKLRALISVLPLQGGTELVCFFSISKNLLRETSHPVGAMVSLNCPIVLTPINRGRSQQNIRFSAIFLGGLRLALELKTAM
jgi:hypothetical protein